MGKSGGGGGGRELLMEMKGAIRGQREGAWGGGGHRIGRSERDTGEGRGVGNYKIDTVKPQVPKSALFHSQSCLTIVQLMNM